MYKWNIDKGLLLCSVNPWTNKKGANEMRDRRNLFKKKSCGPT